MKQNLLFIFVLLVTVALAGQTNPPAATVLADSPAVEPELQGLERTWAEAVKQRDTAKIDQIQAAEFVFTGPTGVVWTKARELETIKSGVLVIDAFDLSDVRVRRYENAAVVTLRVVWTGTYDGNDISGPQRMTDVFVRREGTLAVRGQPGNPHGTASRGGSLKRFIINQYI